MKAPFNFSLAVNVGVCCQQSCDGREALRLARNGHNLGHAPHGPSDDKDTLQCLYDQGIPKSIGKGEVGFVSSAPLRQCA